MGAIYLDKGYARCKRFIIQKLINPYVNLETLIHSDTNFKSRLIEWGQRTCREVRFEIENVKKCGGTKNLLHGYGSIMNHTALAMA